MRQTKIDQQRIHEPRNSWTPGQVGRHADTTLTTYRTRRSPSENSLLYNTTLLCVFLNADKLVWERKISPFYLFTWIFINFRVSTSEFTGTYEYRIDNTRNSERPKEKDQLGKFRRLPHRYNRLRTSVQGRLIFVRISIGLGTSLSCDVINIIVAIDATAL